MRIAVLLSHLPRWPVRFTVLQHCPLRASGPHHGNRAGGNRR